MFWKKPTAAPTTAEDLREKVDVELNRLRDEFTMSAKRVADAVLYAEEVAAMENENMVALTAKIMAAEKQSVALSSIASL